MLVDVFDWMGEKEQISYNLDPLDEDNYESFHAAVAEQLHLDPLTFDLNRNKIQITNYCLLRANKTHNKELKELINDRDSFGLKIQTSSRKEIIRCMPYIGLDGSDLSLMNICFDKLKKMN